MNIFDSYDFEKLVKGKKDQMNKDFLDEWNKMQKRQNRLVWLGCGLAGLFYLFWILFLVFIIGAAVHFIVKFW